MNKFNFKSKSANELMESLDSGLLSENLIKNFSGKIYLIESYLYNDKKDEALEVVHEISNNMNKLMLFSEEYKFYIREQLFKSIEEFVK